MIHFRLTLNINHGITRTVKGFIHPLRTATLWTADKKGQLLLFINISCFYFPSFLPTCLILRDEFKSQL